MIGLPFLETRALTVAFGHGHARFTAVDAAEIAVAAQGRFGLVGESGSGKSTILRAIAGLVPSTGTIRLGGEVLGPKRSRVQRQKIQMVFQDPYGSLNPAHTVDDILAEPLRILGDTLSLPQRIGRALDEVGLLPRHRFRYPHQLSGGQRQRVAIARALITRPQLLLLDEPTSALDVSVQAEVLNLFKRLAREHHLTLVMVSHDLAVIAHMCDTIAVMTQGRIVETLSATALRRREARHPYTRSLLDAAAALGETARA